jgi:isochorismate hydrolase
MQLLESLFGVENDATASQVNELRDTVVGELKTKTESVVNDLRPLVIGDAVRDTLIWGFMGIMMWRMTGGVKRSVRAAENVERKLNGHNDPP